MLSQDGIIIDEIDTEFNNQPIPKRFYLLAVLYSLINGVSTATTIGYSLYDKYGDERYAGPAILTASIAVFVADTIASYSFQGQSILKQPENTGGPEYSEIDISPPTPIDFLGNGEEFELNLDPNKSYKPLLSPEKPQTYTDYEPKNGCVNSSLMKQLGYTLILDCTKNFANRYFFLSALCESFPQLTPSFWYVLTPLFLLKQLFVMSNETYESNQILGNQKNPFYSCIFKPIAKSKKAVKFFCIIGSLDHAVCDDIIPGVVLFPTNIATNGVFIGFAAIISFIVCLQTYLFEGKHTEMHLASLINPNINHKLESKIQNHRFSPNFVTRLIKDMLILMGPLHGIATAAPLYLVLRKLITDDITSRWVSGIIFGLAALIGTIGTHFSEVREAKKELTEPKVEITLTQTPPLN